jgi:glutamate/tyrosine decarboxylase-like PLP-dependent enzyme
VLDLLDRVGSPATVVTTGGRYFGFVNGGVLPSSLAAGWLVGAWDQNVALRAISPIGAACEQVALEWVRDLLGLPAGCAGALVTGATMANVAGLAAARHALLARAGWDVERDGLFGAPPLTVVVGDEVHVSLLKALTILGLGRDRVHRVPSDAQGRMRADSLPPLDPRTILCVQAGNVNTGAFDPAASLCARAADAGAWVHVDGAFGLWAAASPQYRHCGIVLVRNPEPLHAAMSAASAYFTPQGPREPSQFSPEMSRRARGVELWAGLRSLGRQGMANLVERTCGHARVFASQLADAGFEILNEVVINQVLVSFGAPDVTRRIIERVQQEGTCWCGGTEWQGRTAMRISVSSWATTSDDVERSVAAIRRVAASGA